MGRPLGPCLTEAGSTTHVFGTGPGTRFGDRKGHLRGHLAKTSFFAHAGRRRAAIRARGSRTLPVRPIRCTPLFWLWRSDEADGGGGCCDHGSGGMGLQLVPGLFRLHGRTKELPVGTGAERLRGTPLEVNHCAGRCHLFRPRSFKASPQATTYARRVAFMRRTARLIGRACGSGKSGTGARLGCRRRRRRTTLVWATAGFHGWLRGGDLGEQWRRRGDWLPHAGGQPCAPVCCPNVWCPFDLGSLDTGGTHGPSPRG